MALTDDEIRMVTLIDQRFWETGHLVTDEKLAEILNLPEKKIKDAWKKEDFRSALLARGVNLDQDAHKNILTPLQVMLANVLMNTEDTRSVREKLQGLNIKTVTYNGWLRQPAFAQYLRKRAESVFAASDHVAYQALVNAVEEQDVQAIKLYFEMRNIYNPKVQVDVNVQSVIIQLVEIVSRHVTDEDTLTAIANDIEKLAENNRVLPVGSSVIEAAVLENPALESVSGI